MTARGAARVLAQAKLNLALRVLGRDRTGYHPIETLFLRIDLADVVELRVTEGSMVLRCDTDLGKAEDNLAFRAATGFADATGWPAGWEITLEKHIPVGAGLGGGSADAGAVLRALNCLCPTPLTDEKLLSLAAALGADVPFMATEMVFALGEGYGERLVELPAPASKAVGLAIPRFAVATKEAYSWLDRDNAADSKRPKWDSARMTWADLALSMENDFTGVVARRHPEIESIIESFRSAGASMAGMTGSGSAVFGIFDEKPEAGERVLSVDAKVLWTTTASRVVEPRLMD